MWADLISMGSPTYFSGPPFILDIILWSTQVFLWSTQGISFISVVHPGYQLYFCGPPRVSALFLWSTQGISYHIVVHPRYLWVAQDVAHHSSPKLHFPSKTLFIKLTQTIFLCKCMPNKCLSHIHFKIQSPDI